MLTLKKLINFKIIKILNEKHSKQSLRLLCARLEEDRPLSFRTKDWLQGQERYKNHEHILYSSYLEQHPDNMSYALKRSLINKRKLKQHHHQMEEIMQSLQPSVIPKGWMEDYEYYQGSQADSVDVEGNNMGLADMTIASSNVPCNGCGAILHCHQHTKPGFLASEIFKGRSETELKSIICQRCHFLKNYNIALDIEVTPEFYVNTISRIQNEFALAVIIVDLLDFPCSIWPGMQQLLGPKRPVFIVGNKVDLLPRDCNGYLDHIKECLKREVLNAGFDCLNIKHISLISAKTGYGIEELITKLQNIWSYDGDVYLMGCTNVGKSSLFNILLNSDYSRPENAEIIPKATTCPWPGTTLQMLKFPIYRPSDIRIYERLKRLLADRVINAEKTKLLKEKSKKTVTLTDITPKGQVGCTFVHKAHEETNDAFSMNLGSKPIAALNESSKIYQGSRWVYDTPGVMHPDQITNLLTSKELEQIQPHQMITPRAVRLKPGLTLFLGGLARLDYLENDSKDFEWLQVFVFASFKLPILIGETQHSEALYKKYLNTPLLQLPFGDESRLNKWPGLRPSKQYLKAKGYILKPKYKELTCSSDVTLSTAGWVGLRIPVDVECKFQAWTPQGNGVYVRTPSLIPHAYRLIGKKIRNSLAYNTAKPFVFRK
uniref:G domain-containing protein n=1 Tax=Glossina brevipalpis TaxID=37001 RepID=A0A1A9W0V5_9MUSC